MVFYHLNDPQFVQIKEPNKGWTIASHAACFHIQTRILHIIEEGNNWSSW